MRGCEVQTGGLKNYRCFSEVKPVFVEIAEILIRYRNIRHPGLRQPKGFFHCFGPDQLCFDIETCQHIYKGFFLNAASQQGNAFTIEVEDGGDLNILSTIYLRPTV